MNKKKILYFAVWAIILIIIYLNYYSPEREYNLSSKKIETINAFYEKDNYQIEAKKQTDYPSKSNIFFEFAKVQFKGIVLSGDEVVIDKHQNLSFKNNIIGESEKEWILKTEELKFLRSTESITSFTKTILSNDIKKVSIEGDNLITSLSLDKIYLYKNIALNSEDITVTGDKLLYVEEKNKIFLIENIKLTGKNPEKKITGKFKNLVYNIEDEDITTDTKFDITLNDVVISGNQLELNPKRGSFFAEGDVNIGYKENLFKISTTFKDENSNIINMIGPVNGGNTIYKISSENGSYNLETKEFLFIGAVTLKSSNGETLTADEMIYNEDKQIIYAYGKDIQAIYSGSEHRLQSRNIIYNFELKELEGKDSYIYENLENDYKFSGDDFKIGLNNKKYETIGKVIFENSEYVLETSDFSGNLNEKDIVISKDYVLRIIKNDVVFEGEKAKFKGETKDFLSFGKTKIKKDGFTANGKDLIYANQTESGTLNGPIDIIYPEREMKVVGDKINFKQDSNLDIIGNVMMTIGDNIMESELVSYNSKSESISIPNMIRYKNQLEGLKGTLSKGDFDLAKNIFFGQNFKGNFPKIYVSSDKLEYDLTEKNLNLLENVVMKDNHFKMSGQNIKYSTDNQLIEFISEIKIDYDKVKMTSSQGIINLEENTLRFENPDFISEMGDKFKADELYGNLNSDKNRTDIVLNFRGDASGETYSNKEKTTYNGESVVVYLRDLGSNYNVNRVELKGNSLIKNQNKEIEAKYIEIDFVKNTIFAKERPKFSIKNEKNRELIGYSDTFTFYKETQIGELDGNLSFNLKDNLNKEFHLTAERGILKEKENMVELFEKVYMKTEENSVKSDFASYDMENRKIKLKGNIKIEYK